MLISTKWNYHVVCKEINVVVMIVESILFASNDIIEGKTLVARGKTITLSIEHNARYYIKS